MELIEIIKHTVFLLTLLGFGIFSLSYSIYKIRTRNKIKPVVQTFSAQNNFTKIHDNPTPFNNRIKIPASKTTAERFLIINNLNDYEQQKHPAAINKDKGYRMQLIKNTGMYTLKFK